MKHTPGPWEYHETCALGHDYVLAKRPGSSAIAHISNMDCPSKDESKANARLIAAAPELLEHLKAIVSEIDDMAIFDDSERWESILGAAKAAIAKAERGE